MKKLFEGAKRIGASVAHKADSLSLQLAVITVGTLASVGASAQTTDPFDTAMTTVTDKVEGYAAALVGLAAVAVVFMVALKYVKRIPRAS